jgi:hypothetical protein
MASRLTETLGRIWARIVRKASSFRRRAEARERQLRAEARLLGAEVRVLGAAYWGPVDALPFTAARQRFPPVRTQYYGHGAFMGATPALLADPRWRRILAFLMPDVYAALEESLAAGADASSLMPMLENNPVLAAFGTVAATNAHREGEHPNHLAGMEWDLFVNTDLITEWEEAADDAARSAVMDRVVDTSLIAHANAIDTVQESLGISQYPDVRRSPKTAFGGVEMDAWLDLFGRALHLARTDAFDAEVAAMASEPRSASDEACMRGTFATPWSVDRVTELHQQVTGRPHLSIVIDIKSLRSTPPFLTGLIGHLNRFGVHVAAVGSFLPSEIEGLSRASQQVRGRTLPGPREVLFFHLAGDLQLACEAGSLSPGQCVMFNGGSLLDVVTPEPGRHTYSSRLRVLDELERWRARLDLQIGIYVQEGDCDAAAAAVLSDIVDAWPATFALGFAWGGLRDEAGLPAGPDPRVGYGAQRLLEHVGRARQWRLGDPEEPAA